jgi:integrase
LRLDARRWAQSTEAAIRERRYFKTKEAQRRTLGELVDRYIRDVIPKKAPWARAQVEQLAYWRAELGGRTLADVTPAVIAEARDKLARGVTVRGRQRGPGTTNRYLSALSHAFVVAVREWQWLEDNPLRKVTKPKEPRGRVR